MSGSSARRTAHATPELCIVKRCGQKTVEDVPYFESPPLHTVHMSTSSSPGGITCLFDASRLTLFSFKYDALPFEISRVYTSFTLLALINITAVYESLKLADSFPEVVNPHFLLTLESSSLLLPPSFPHPLLKSNICRIDVNHT